MGATLMGDPGLPWLIIGIWLVTIAVIIAVIIAVEGGARYQKMRRDAEQDQVDVDA